LIHPLPSFPSSTDLPCRLCSWPIEFTPGRLPCGPVPSQTATAPPLSGPRLRRRAAARAMYVLIDRIFLLLLLLLPLLLLLCLLLLLLLLRICSVADCSTSLCATKIELEPVIDYVLGRSRWPRVVRRRQCAHASRSNPQNLFCTLHGGSASFLKTGSFPQGPFFYLGVARSRSRRGNEAKWLEKAATIRVIRLCLFAAEIGA
jgi:hypothetical protein